MIMNAIMPLTKNALPAHEQIVMVRCCVRTPRKDKAPEEHALALFLVLYLHQLLDGLGISGLDFVAYYAAHIRPRWF